MMIAFIAFNSSSVPLIEGLCSSNPCDFEFSGFRQKWTDDLGMKSPSLGPTKPRLHVIIVHEQNASQAGATKEFHWMVRIELAKFAAFMNKPDEIEAVGKTEVL